MCFKQNVTRETFLEAASLLAEEDAELMSKLVAIASEHCECRKVAKEERKFQTLLSRREQKNEQIRMWSRQDHSSGAHARDRVVTTFLLQSQNQGANKIVLEGKAETKSLASV